MEELTDIFIAVLLQIAGMLKDNEKIQSNPTTAPSDDDSEIKKIKKVGNTQEFCSQILWAAYIGGILTIIEPHKWLI